MARVELLDSAEAFIRSLGGNVRRRALSLDQAALAEPRFARDLAVTGSDLFEYVCGMADHDALDPNDGIGRAIVLDRVERLLRLWVWSLRPLIDVLAAVPPNDRSDPELLRLAVHARRVRRALARAGDGLELRDVWSRFAEFDAL